MFDDIVICEISHEDPDGNEYCNPHEIAIGNSMNEGILVSLLFKNDHEPRLDTRITKPTTLEISAEVLDHEDDNEFKEMYDVQTGVVIKIRNKNELCDILVGSNGEHFHYFTNTPSINNTTDFGDTIFLNFPHTVEGFTYNDNKCKVFK
jgi:hypothetical protein